MFTVFAERKKKYTRPIYAEYNTKNNEVKRSAREDNRNWLEKRAAAAEKAAENRRSKELNSSGNKK